MRLLNWLKPISILCIAVVLSSCWATKTDDADKAFSYWARQSPDHKKVTPIRGQYWQSPHFTLEYVAYLQLVIEPEWKKELLELNEMYTDSTKFYRTENTPVWFLPPDSSILYKTKLQQSLYIWVDCTSDTIWVYDQYL